MKRSSLIILTVLACLFIAGSAGAQYEYYGEDYDIYNPRWSVHAGFVWLSGDIEDDTSWLIGLDYESPVGAQYRDTVNDYFTVSFDYIPISTNTTGDESIIPLLIGFRKYGIIPPIKVYFGIGIGTRWASEDIPELQIDDGFDFAWSASIGFNFTPDFLGQARFIGGSEPDEDGVFSLELGYRF
ncbi:MAG: hypothetical protein ABFD46_12370 [Armatimonadota bacterium]